MGRISRNEEIIRKVEALALDMLTKVEGTKEAQVTLDLKMDVFERVCKWIQIRNKIEDPDGGAIGDYKRRLAGEDTAHVPPSRRPKNRNPAGGGEALTALKSRLPSADDGNAHDNSDAAVG